MHRRKFIAGLSTATLSVTGCLGGSDGGSDGGDGNSDGAGNIVDGGTVEMNDNSFEPMKMFVNLGQPEDGEYPPVRVTWENAGSSEHDITSAKFHDGPHMKEWDFESGSIASAETAEFTFKEYGKYEYYCSIHGKETMCGVVIVNTTGSSLSFSSNLPCEEDTGFSVNRPSQ